MFDAKSPVQPFHLMAASSFHSLVFTQIGCCELHPVRQGQCAVATSLLRQPLRHAWSRCVSGVSFFRAGEMATRTHLESHSSNYQSFFLSFFCLFLRTCHGLGSRDFNTKVQRISPSPPARHRHGTPPFFFYRSWARMDPNTRHI